MARKGKSWDDIETQGNNLWSALGAARREGRISEEEYVKRLQRVQDAQFKYEHNIENSKAYKSLMRKSQEAKEWRYDPLMESGAYYSTEKSRQLFDKADRMKVSRNTYMGLNKG